MASSQAFDGRAVLVTGGTRGIGRAIAEHLGGLGAAVTITGRDRARGEAVVERLRAGGGQAWFVAADMADAAAVPRAVQEAARNMGGLDVLVNNAAYVGEHSTLLDTPLDEWRTVIDTNLTGTFLASQAAARAMVAANEPGAIVNVLAIQSQLPIGGYGAYVASKGGLDALTRVLALELARHRIRVNGVVVGSVYTEGTREAVGGGQPADPEGVPAALDAAAATLVGRMGRPSEIARAVAFLASDEAAFLTGSLLLADGGRILNRAPDPLIPPQP